MEEHRPRKLLEQVRACPELGEGMPSASNYDTSDDHETVTTRAPDLQDNATPSGNALAATTLLKLARFTSDVRYVDSARKALAQMQPMMAQYPLGFGQWLQALVHALSKPREITIVGEPEAAQIQALLDVVRDGCRPFQVVVLGAPSSEGAQVPSLADRGPVDGRPTAYVCQAFVCQAPVTTPQALEGLLSGNREHAVFVLP